MTNAMTHPAGCVVVWGARPGHEAPGGVGFRAVDLIGKTIDGRYRVSRRLGKGGMGELYVAHQHALGRDVALKVLPERDAHDVDVTERFIREARALSQMQDDHVVVVHDTGVCASTGAHYIAMELLNGETLRARMRRPIAADEANAIVAQLLRGLDAVHRVGIVHRDVKPENVMLVDGRVKLVDFGIARRVDGGATLTATGAFVGTPGYAAPERAFGDRGDDPRGDLYAVGVIWFELLTGGVLFDGPGALAVAMRHASEPAPRVSSRVAVDPDVDDTIAALLAKTPDARPALRAVLDVADRPRSGRPPASPPTSVVDVTVTETMTIDGPLPARTPPPSSSSSSSSSWSSSSPGSRPTPATGSLVIPATPSALPAFDATPTTSVRTLDEVDEDLIVDCLTRDRADVAIVLGGIGSGTAILAAVLERTVALDPLATAATLVVTTPIALKLVARAGAKAQFGLGAQLVARGVAADVASALVAAQRRLPWRFLFATKKRPLARALLAEARRTVDVLPPPTP